MDNNETMKRSVRDITFAFKLATSRKLAASEVILNWKLNFVTEGHETILTDSRKMMVLQIEQLENDLVQQQELHHSQTHELQNDLLKLHEMQQEAPPAADEDVLDLLNNRIRELEEEVVLDHEISEVLRSENKRLEDELKASKAVSAAHDEDSTEATEAEAAKAADKAAKAAEMASFVATPKFETKFNQLDSDKSGFLNLEELEELAQWVYISFRADNASLDQDKLANEANKLMKKLDKDGDQKICIEEFRAYFEDRAKKSAKFTAKMKEKGKHSHDMFADDPEPAAPEQATGTETDLEMTRAFIKEKHEALESPRAVEEVSDEELMTLAAARINEKADMVGKKCQVEMQELRLMLEACRLEKQQVEEIGAHAASSMRAELSALHTKALEASRALQQDNDLLEAELLAKENELKHAQENSTRERSTWREERWKLMNEVEQQNKEVCETLAHVSSVETRLHKDTTALEHENTELAVSKKDLVEENDKLTAQLKETQKAYYVLYNVSNQAGSQFSPHSPLSKRSPPKISSQHSSEHEKSPLGFDF